MAKHRHAQGFGNQPYLKPALLAVDLGHRQAGTVDGDIAFGKHVGAECLRNAKTYLVVGLGTQHLQHRRGEIHVARQGVSANLCAVSGGALNVEHIAHLVAAQRGDVQALQHDIERGAGGREQLGHRQADTIVRNAGANGQVLAKAFGKFHGEGAQTFLIVQRGNACHGLNDAGEHGAGPSEIERQKNNAAPACQRTQV